MNPEELTEIDLLHEATFRYRYVGKLELHELATLFETTPDIMKAYYLEQLSLHKAGELPLLVA